MQTAFLKCYIELEKKGKSMPFGIYLFILTFTFLNSESQGFPSSFAYFHCHDK